LALGGGTGNLLEGRQLALRRLQLAANLGLFGTKGRTAFVEAAAVQRRGLGPAGALVAILLGKVSSKRRRPLLCPDLTQPVGRGGDAPFELAESAARLRQLTVEAPDLVRVPVAVRPPAALVGFESRE